MGASVVTRVHTPPVLERSRLKVAASGACWKSLRRAVEHILDFVTLAIERAVMFDQYFSIGFRRNARRDAALGESLAEPVGVISLVAEELPGARQRGEQASSSGGSCQGPGSPTASARIQPVLRRSSPSRPSSNKPAEAATRSCVNNGPILDLIFRSDEAQSSSVVSIEALVIHDLRIMVTHGFRQSQNVQL
jgi:hypothetical protein